MSGERLAAERIRATSGDSSITWTPPLRTEDVLRLLDVATKAEALLAALNFYGDEHGECFPWLDTEMTALAAALGWSPPDSGAL